MRRRIACSTPYYAQLRLVQGVSAAETKFIGLPPNGAITRDELSFQPYTLMLAKHNKSIGVKFNIKEF